MGRNAILSALRSTWCPTSECVGEEKCSREEPVMEMKEICSGKIHMRAAAAGLEAGINWHWWGYQGVSHRFLVWTFPFSAECVHAWACFCLFPYRPNWCAQACKRKCNMKMDPLSNAAVDFYTQIFLQRFNARLTSLYFHKGSPLWDKYID